MTLNKLRALTENERYSGGGGGLSCSQVCEGAVGEISSIKAKSDFASSLMRGRKIIALRVVPHAAPASAERINALFVSGGDAALLDQSHTPAAKSQR